jgi:thiol-disulfide isomerase/thioredoxin
MKYCFLVFAFCLATLAQAASVPFPLADVPIPEAGQGPQFVNGKIIMPKPTGKLIDVKKYRGKPLIVAMISMTCGHCVTAIQYLMQLQDTYRDKGLQVLGVAGDQHASVELPQWLQRFRPNFAFGYLDKDPFLKLAGMAPDARPFAPVILFVDPSGTVRTRMLGNDPEMKNPQEALTSATKGLLAMSTPIVRK